MIRVSNEERKKIKEDPRYKLLDFAVKHFKKTKMLENNQEYFEFHERFPYKSNSNKMHQILSHLKLNYISYDNYAFIYDEMVKLGYKGVKPERKIKVGVPKSIKEAPLYMKESFHEDNKIVIKDGE